MEKFEAHRPIIPTEIKNIKKFETKVQNEDYELKVYKDYNKIIFSINKKGNELLIYENEYTLDDLFKSNENLKCFNSLDILYNSLEELFENNKIIIEKDENNLHVINLVILIYNFLGKEIKCLLNLNLKEIKGQDCNKKLMIEILELKKTIAKKYEEIKSLNEKFDKLNKKMEILENELKSIKSSKKVFQFEQSEIIKNEINRDLIINRLIKDFPNISFELIYKPTNKNETSDDFHKICDGKENVLVLIKTTDDIKFGGFTSVGFNSSSGYTKDDKAFLFSLDKNKIYNIKKGQDAIYCREEKGLCFYSKNFSNINIQKRLFLDRHNTSYAKDNCYEINNDFELNNGKLYFYVKNLEIYQVKNN